MKRKVVSIMLASAMVAGMLAGCGSDSGSTGGSTDTGSSTADTASADSADDTSPITFEYFNADGKNGNWDNPVAKAITEATVITLIVTPILIPIITQYGIDPVHFGIIMMTIVTMGCSTPPVGVALYTCSNIMDCSVQETTKYSLPLFIAIMATLAICVFFPDLVLFLPNMIYGTSM